MAMIYLIYGDDSYRSWQKLQEIKRKYLDTSMDETDLAVIDASDLTLEAFRRQVQTLPFLAKKRLVIIRDLLSQGKQEVKESVAGILPSIPSTTLVFFYESGTPDKRQKLFQMLNKPKLAQQFQPLAGASLTNYLVEYAKEQGLALRPALANELVSLLGPDLWRLTQELEKLALYKMSSLTEIRLGGIPDRGSKNIILAKTGIPDQVGNDRKVVLEEDIRLLVSGTPEARVFDLLDALGMRNRPKALQLLSRLPAQEVDLGLLALIAGHYRNLVLIADGLRQGQTKQQLAQALKLHPFVFAKAFDQAGRYSYEELAGCFQYLFQLDLAAKQSLIEPGVGLTALAGSLSDRPLLPPNLSPLLQM